MKPLDVSSIVATACFLRTALFAQERWSAERATPAPNATAKASASTPPISSNTIAGELQASLAKLRWRRRWRFGIAG
jgi:hypothetical protein